MILERIKIETLHNHKLLESNAVLSNLMTENLTVDDYTKIISKFYTYFSPLENKIFPFFEDDTHVPDFSKRRKASLLLDDLNYYKTSKTTIDFCNNLPEVNNLNQAMGILYVLEGSTLGGRFISKKIKETIGATPESGAKFYNGYGAETGIYWKNFCGYLSSYAQKQSDQSEVIESANNTFLKLNAWLDQKTE